MFKLKHLLACNLLKFNDDLEDMTTGASKECGIERKLNDIDGEWSGLELVFAGYHARGDVILSQTETGELIEKLEEARGRGGHLHLVPVAVVLGSRRARAPRHVEAVGARHHGEVRGGVRRAAQERAEEKPLQAETRARHDARVGPALGGVAKAWKRAETRFASGGDDVSALLLRRSTETSFWTLLQ